MDYSITVGIARVGRGARKQILEAFMTQYVCSDIVAVAGQPHCMHKSYLTNFPSPNILFRHIIRKRSGLLQLSNLRASLLQLLLGG